MRFESFNREKSFESRTVVKKGNLNHLNRIGRHGIDWSLWQQIPKD
jgi:hypothetical protein